MILSIIIPVYNTEKFLEKTLDSILEQQFSTDAYEIIAINDGSSDASLSILEYYSRNYPNFSIINQENGGPGPGLARNAGLESAKGDYIWYVDSDDTVCSNSLELISQTIKEHPDLDIYGYDIWKVFEKDSFRKEYSFTINNPRLRNKYNCVVTDELRAFLRGTIWCFIFSRQFLFNNDLFFLPRILHEDMEFMTRAFFLSSTMLIVDKPIYNYLIRTNGSIMSSIKLNYYEDKLFVIESLEKVRNKKTNDDSAQNYLNTSIFRIALSIIVPNDYSRVHQEQTLTFITKHSKEIRRFANSGIIPLLGNKEYKPCLMALLMNMPKLLYYTLSIRDKYLSNAK